MRVHQATSVKGNFCNKLRMLSFFILSGLLIATNGFEKDCGKLFTEPCKIFSYSDLKNIEKNGLDRNYLLMNDIQAPTNPPDKFPPIGGVGEGSFSGYLDGDGHTIHDIYLVEEYTVAAMFSTIYYSAGFKNLIFKNPTAVSQRIAGVLAGFMDDSKVENVVVINPNVTGRLAGGLLGEAGGVDISHSHVIGGTVKSSGPDAFGTLGGLVGNVRFGLGSIRHSSAENVQVESQDGEKYTCGGLVGDQGELVFEDTFATGNVSCDTAGGLVGSNSYEENIKRSYAVANLKASVRSGGLVGRSTGTVGNSPPGVVKDNFAVFEIIGVPPHSNASSCLVNMDVENGDVRLENNYCFKKGPVSGVSSKPGVNVAGSPNRFLGKNNKEPTAQWSNQTWTFKARKYPSLNKLFVDSGGPYKWNVADKPVHLDRAAASQADFLHWEVNSTSCSFLDKTVLKPVLSCNTGNAKFITEACLTGSNDGKTIQRCTIVHFPPKGCSRASCLSKREKMESYLDSIRPLFLEMNGLKNRGLLVKMTRHVQYVLLSLPLRLEHVESARDEVEKISRTLRLKVKAKQISQEEKRSVERNFKVILKLADRLDNPGCCGEL